MSSTSPVGVAVVGAGLLGTRHARVHHESPHATLVAVCDHDLARARGVAEPRGARAYDAHRALFDAHGPGGDGTLAAVSVATPDDAHRDVVCDALAAGLDVFVEKPLAMSLRDADAMIEAAERHGRVLAVNYSQRWLPEHKAVAAHVSDGSLGDVTFVESHRWDAAWVPQRMIGKWAHRTTPIHFMSSHDIDLIVHWLNDRVRRVTAVARRGALERQYGLQGVVDGYVALLEFSRGAVATLHSSWLLPETFPLAADATLELHGARGAAFLGTSTRELRLYLQDRAEKTVYSGPATATEVNGRLEGAFTESLHAFLGAVRTRDVALSTSAARTRHVVEIQEAILTAAASGAAVAITEEER
jgi:predicted dehydrogenase